MTQPRLLDLFCKAGGAARGYADAGFDVVGVDVKPQPRYPFEFIQADALDVLEDLGGYFMDPRFVVIHASPPCQAYSITRHGHKKQYPDLVGVVRAALKEWGGTYVIENVVGAPLINPVRVCGTAFGLEATDDDGTRLYLKRHRLFESNVQIFGSVCECRVMRAMPNCWVGGVYGGARRNREEARTIRHGGYVPSFEKQKQLMGIDWMTEKEMYEAIPPEYTRWIGTQLMAALREEPNVSGILEAKATSPQRPLTFADLAALEPIR